MGIAKNFAIRMGIDRNFAIRIGIARIFAIRICIAILQYFLAAIYCNRPLLMRQKQNLPWEIKPVLGHADCSTLIPSIDILFVVPKMDFVKYNLHNISLIPEMLPK